MEQQTTLGPLGALASLSKGRIPFLTDRTRRKAPHVPHVGGGGVVPMPDAHVNGPGRDRRFRLPQYFATVNGLRTAFFDAGEGPALVFIHGLAGNATHWLHVAPRYAGRFRVVGIDLPGCGETEPAKGKYSVRTYADHVRTLLDILGIERASLFGHSLGGMVATEFAFTYRERTDSVFLVNPAGFQPMPLPVRLAGHLMLRPALLNTVLPRAWRGVLANVFCESNEHTEAFIRTVDETYSPTDIYGMSAVMAGLRHDLLNRNFAAVLDQLDVPAYLVWGDKDRLVPARYLRNAARKMPNVTIEEIPRCGHMPIIEKPEQLNAFFEVALARIAKSRAA